MTELSARLQQLHDAGTPGPWDNYNPGDGTGRLYAITGPGEDDCERILNVVDGHGSGAYLSGADGALIVALRNHTPEIIAALEAVERVREAHRLVTLSPDFSITPNVWYGECSCHAPDGLGVGRADFYGATPQDVVDAQLDHAIRALDGAPND